MGLPVHEITFNETLAYQNVVSRRARFPYREFGDQLESFVSDVAEHGGTPKGGYFYSLNNVPLDEVTDIELFLPIRESTFRPREGMFFHSYFEISPLARGVVTANYEQQTEYVYAQLLAALEHHELEINAPFFHCLPGDGSAYVSVYLGYVDRAEASEGLSGSKTVRFTHNPEGDRGALGNELKYLEDHGSVYDRSTHQRPCSHD